MTVGYFDLKAELDELFPNNPGYSAILLESTATQLTDVELATLARRLSGKKTEGDVLREVRKFSATEATAMLGIAMKTFKKWVEASPFEYKKSYSHRNWYTYAEIEELAHLHGRVEMRRDTHGL